MTRLFTSLLVVAFVSAPSFARTWNIQPDGSGEAPSIQAGIDSAAVGDTVLLGPGVYTGAANKNLEFRGKDVVVRSSCGPEFTAIDCEGGGRGFYLHEGESYGAAIEGLTIRNGNALSESGGGIFVDDLATIRDCRLIENTARYGGGIFGNSAGVRIYDCLFEGNSASSDGGAISAYGYALEVYRSVFRSNSAQSGGAIDCQVRLPHLRVDSCLIVDNFAEVHGGGILFDSYQVAGYCEILQSTIARNVAGDWGGGMLLYTAGPEVVFENSIVWGNCANYGSQIASADFSSIFILTSDIDTSGIVECAIFLDEASVSEDPLFCDPGECSGIPGTSGDYTLDAASPCLPAQTGGELFGYHGQGCDIYTSVAEDGSMPARAFGLFVSPNPTAGEVALRYSRAANAPVTMRVFDIRGRVVRDLVATGPTGVVVWDGRNASGRAVAPGVYFVRMEEGTRDVTARVVVVR